MLFAKRHRLSKCFKMYLKVTLASLVTRLHLGMIRTNYVPSARKWTSTTAKTIELTRDCTFAENCRSTYTRHTYHGGRRLTVSPPLWKLPVGHGFKTSRLLPRACSAAFGYSRPSSTRYRRCRYCHACLWVVCTHRKGTRLLFFSVFVGTIREFARRCATQMLCD